MNQAVRQKNIIVICTVFATILVSATMVQARYFCVRQSEKYLQEANKVSDFRTSLIDLEIAALLNPSYDTRILVSNKLITGGQYTAAGQYLRGLSGEMAEKAYAKVKYGLKNYVEATNISSKYPDDIEMSDIYTQSLLSVGDLERLGAVVKTAKNSSKVATLSSLAVGTGLQLTIFTRATQLKNAGYPQAALALLEDSMKNNSLDRDAYFMLGKEYSRASKIELAYGVYKKALEIDPYYPQVYQQLILVGKELNNKADIAVYEERLAALSW